MKNCRISASHLWQQKGLISLKTLALVHMLYICACWILFNPLWSLKSGFSSPWNLHDIATVATWMNLTWNSLQGVRSDSHHPETADWSAESTGGHYSSKWVSTQVFIFFHIFSYFFICFMFAEDLRKISRFMGRVWQDVGTAVMISILLGTTRQDRGVQGDVGGYERG